MLYVYMDESEFAQPNNYVGMGSLISNEPISHNLIEAALQNLRNDPDSKGNRMDEATLERGFFHACVDSKNAHSHLMTVINSQNLYFYCDFYSKAGERSEMQVHKDKISSSFLTSIINVSLYEHKEIRFLIERRAKESDDFYNNLKKILYNKISEEIYEQPWLKTYFPNVKVEIVDKNEPGVQFVDFLLWTINRKHNDDAIWYDRIKARLRISMSSEPRTWGGESFSIKKGIDGGDKNLDYLEIFPKNPDDLINNEDLITFFINARKLVEFFYKNKNEGEEYFFESYVEEITSSNIPKFFESTVDSFLMIFDNKGVVDNIKEKDKKVRLLLARKYLSLTKNMSYINGVRTKVFFINYLSDNIENIKISLKR